ncbi:MAG: ferritin [Campylobacterota bacterium]
MISQKMTEALNKQLNKEYHSAYIYLGLSAYASKLGYNGCASWFMVQYQEEVAHGMKIYSYLDDQGADIELLDIKAFNFKGEGIKNAFEEAFKHEQKMTGWLNDLSDLALKEKDHATYNMLQWFVMEQVEEEALFSEIIDKINLIGESGNGMYSLDKELGARTFVDPTQEG